MKKIKLNNEKCIGCGACTAIDPEHFDFDTENNICQVISQDNIENSNSVQEAIDSCPVGAISMYDGCENPKCTCDPCECGDECSCGDECDCDSCNCNK